MLWDLIQQAQISQAKWEAQNANSTAVDVQVENRLVKGRIEKLEETVDRISLAAMAVAEIVRDRLGVTQDEIEAKVQEIDLRDGKLDGRLREPTNDCTHCHHINAPHRRKCLYCGEPLPAGSGLFSPPAS
jgi:hypothetical protein